ncbi:mannose-1-phosphate guanylyltransferase [Pseudomonas putida]|uniref:Mannose-1-phosphate guanylyltransferase n=1 Tax=Pseudomonas putida TaxID=303 RepID=A0A2Z4RST8_PSEPU|nr:mannose-1-phosphate guanylyltransferase [Pseudomonas putida]AWY43715.1 mannose-1-phosphate guanylyltransferase [Pseudomonas putida]
MNIAQHSADIEREVGNLGVMSWLSRHQTLPSANEPWLGAPLLVEQIGVFPSSGDIRRPMPDPYPLLAHLKDLYGGQALEIDDRDGLKVIFSDWRFRVRLCCNTPAIIINVETRCDLQLMPLRTAELLNQLELFETAHSAL